MANQPAHRDVLEIRDVVVGVDGSAESLAALAWATEVAGPDGVVYARAVVSPTLALAAAAGQYDPSKLLAHVEFDLTNAWAADAIEQGRTVVCDVVEDDPADALLRRADDLDADLLVVGVHAKPALAPRTVGRVTTKLIQHARVPLVVVDAATPIDPTAPPTVVVGAGHGSATRAAIDWAAAYSERSGTALRLVRSIPHRPVFGVDGLLGVAAFYIDPHLLVEWATEDLLRFADEIQDSTVSDVTISESVEFGSPGPRLVEAGAGASLLVIGRHERSRDGGPMPLALHHVLTHAPCPVVVVPPPHQD